MRKYPSNPSTSSTRMSRTYHKILKMCVGEILMQTGFPRTTDSALTCATDVLQYFIEQVIRSIQTVDVDVCLLHMLSKYADSEHVEFIKLQNEENVGSSDDMLTCLKILPKNYEWFSKQTTSTALSSDKKVENLPTSIDESVFVTLDLISKLPKLEDVKIQCTTESLLTKCCVLVDELEKNALNSGLRHSYGLKFSSFENFQIPEGNSFQSASQKVSDSNRKEFDSIKNNGQSINGSKAENPGNILNSQNMPDSNIKEFDSIKNNEQSINGTKAENPGNILISQNMPDSNIKEFTLPDFHEQSIYETKAEIPANLPDSRENPDSNIQKFTSSDFNMHFNHSDNEVTRLNPKISSERELNPENTESNSQTGEPLFQSKNSEIISNNFPDQTQNNSLFSTQASQHNEISTFLKNTNELSDSVDFKDTHHLNIPNDFETQLIDKFSKNNSFLEENKVTDNYFLSSKNHTPNSNDSLQPSIEDKFYQPNFYIYTNFIQKNHNQTIFKLLEIIISELGKCKQQNSLYTPFLTIQKIFEMMNGENSKGHVLNMSTYVFLYIQYCMFSLNSHILGEISKKNSLKKSQGSNSQKTTKLGQKDTHEIVGKNDQNELSKNENIQDTNEGQFSNTTQCCIQDEYNLKKTTSFDTNNTISHGVSQSTQFDTNNTIQEKEDVIFQKSTEFPTENTISDEVSYCTQFDTNNTIQKKEDVILPKSTQFDTKNTISDGVSQSTQFDTNNTIPDGFSHSTQFDTESTLQDKTQYVFPKSARFDTKNTVQEKDKDTFSPTTKFDTNKAVQDGLSQSTEFDKIDKVPIKRRISQTSENQSLNTIDHSTNNLESKKEVSISKRIKHSQFTPIHDNTDKNLFFENSKPQYQTHNALQQSGISQTRIENVQTQNEACSPDSNTEFQGINIAFQNMFFESSEKMYKNYIKNTQNLDNLILLNEISNDLMHLDSQNNLQKLTQNQSFVHDTLFDYKSNTKNAFYTNKKKKFIQRKTDDENLNVYTARFSSDFIDDLFIDEESDSHSDT